MDADLYRLLRKELSTQEGVAAMLNVSRETLTRREKDKHGLSLESILALIFLHNNKRASAQLLLVGLVKNLLDEGFRSTNEIVKTLRGRKDYNQSIKPFMRALEIRATVEQVRSMEQNMEDHLWFQMEIILRASRHHREEAAKVILKRLVRQLMVERNGITKGEVMEALRDKHDYMVAVFPNLSELSIQEIVNKKFVSQKNNQREI